jgi:hypothetical protein
MIAWKWQPGKDSQERTARRGQPRLDSKKGKSGRDSQDRTAKTEQAEHDRTQDRQGSQYIKHVLKKNTKYRILGFCCFFFIGSHLNFFFRFPPLYYKPCKSWDRSEGVRATVYQLPFQLLCLLFKEEKVLINCNVMRKFSFCVFICKNPTVLIYRKFFAGYDIHFASVSSRKSIFILTVTFTLKPPRVNYVVLTSGLLTPVLDPAPGDGQPLDDLHLQHLHTGSAVLCQSVDSTLDPPPPLPGLGS